MADVQRRAKALKGCRGTSDRRMGLMKALARTTPTRAPTIPAEVHHPTGMVHSRCSGSISDRHGQSHPRVSSCKQQQWQYRTQCAVPPHVSLLTPTEQANGSWELHPLSHGNNHSVRLVSEASLGGNLHPNCAASVAGHAEEAQANAAADSTSAMCRPTQHGAVLAPADSRVVRRSLLSHPEFC